MLQTTLTFQENSSGGDPLAFIDHVPVFPGRGHKGLVAPGETWECDIVFMSQSVIMVGPISKAAPGDLVGKIRHTAGAQTRVVTVEEACRLIGFVPRPKLQALETRPPPARPKPTSNVQTAGPSNPKTWALSNEGEQVIRGIIERTGLETKLAGAVEEVRDELQGVLDGNLGQMRQQMRDLASQVEAFRRSAQEWERGRNADLRGVPKLAPKDPEKPTDEEVERELVHQLYRSDAWGAKYKPLDNIRGGFNAKVPEAQVNRAVRTLTTRGWIAHYAKSEDMYRLNPKRARDIYRFLGAPDRVIDSLVTQAEEAGDESAARLTRKDMDGELRDVLRASDLERQLAPIRASLNVKEAQSVPSDGATDILRRDLKTAVGAMNGLQGEVNRLKAVVEELVLKSRRPSMPPQAS